MDVVLLNDGSHDLEPVREALREEAGRLITIESTANALTALQSGAVKAFLVAVSSMTDERVELARCICEQGGFTGNSILLCKGRQAEDAFHLCRAGVFHDYISIDPFYDTYRLRLAVCRAMDTRSGERDLSAIGRDLGEVRQATTGVSIDLGDGIAHVIELIREALANGSAGSNAADR